MPDQKKLSQAFLQSWPIRKLSRSDGAAAPPRDHIQFDLFSRTIDEEQGIVRQPTRTEPKRTMSSYTHPREHRRPRKSHRGNQLRLLFCFSFIAIMLYRPVAAVHHMKRAPIAYVAQRSESSKPLVVENLCQETIYPGMATQAGDGPGTGGFRLSSGAQQKFSVSADWQGRVWARTNCSFNAMGTGPMNVGGVDGSGAACVTGDCFGVVDCVVAVRPLFYILISEWNAEMDHSGQTTHLPRRIYSCHLLRTDLLRHLPRRRLQYPHRHRLSLPAIRQFFPPGDPPQPHQPHLRWHRFSARR